MASSKCRSALWMKICHMPSSEEVAAMRPRASAHLWEWSSVQHALGRGCGNFLGTFMTCMYMLTELALNLSSAGKWGEISHPSLISACASEIT
eukprot:3181739-Pyramimonas_sp.AAC.1